jgi:hypothetical protein
MSRVGRFYLPCRCGEQIELPANMYRGFFATCERCGSEYLPPGAQVVSLKWIDGARWVWLAPGRRAVAGAGKEPNKAGHYWLTPEGRAELREIFTDHDDGNAVRPLLDALERAESAANGVAPTLAEAREAAIKAGDIALGKRVP